MRVNAAPRKLRLVKRELRPRFRNYRRVRVNWISPVWQWRGVRPRLDRPDTRPETNQ